jgi:hypothetical protein
MVAVLLTWLAASCGRGPAHIAVSAPGVPTDAKPPAAPPDDAGDDASWLTEALRDTFPPVALEGADSSTPDARLAVADASASGDASTAPALIDDSIPGVDFPVYCVAWVHNANFSTDCYRTAQECERARQGWTIGHHTGMKKCERMHHAACTTELRYGTERCFETGNNCVRYRNYMAEHGRETTVCVYR